MTAVAAAALMGFWGTQANALSLGRVNVLSALGEPLKADIEILDINAEEAASLSAKVAPPEAFKAAGLDYNAAMTSLQATLQRRANGRPYLRLSGDRAINDPFVDMILEASWNTGRIVRDYTMLFDPPSLRSAATTSITPAQVPAQAPPRPVVQTAPASLEAKAPPRVPTPAVAVKPTPAPKQPEPQQNTGGAPQVTVKAGDTAGRIAAANKPANVSLDQMLVALLRANPNAFIGDNVNRIKAGALVTLPNEAQANATTPAQASQIIVAQSQDFNDFRRKLASNAPTTQVAPASREVTGKVQASVEDKKPSAVTPDKLTLSKGVVTGKTTEDQLAQARAAKETANRATELAKNLQDLSKLAAASSAGTAASVVAAASEPKQAKVAMPGLPTPKPELPAASAPAPVASVSAIAAASAPPAVASTPAPVATASAPTKPASKAAPALPQPMAEPSFVDGLLENPLLPAGGLGLIALLAGLGFYKARQRKNAAAQDSTFRESRLQPESFFGGTGGQNVDTNDNGATGSSMIYSPSQLDAVDDVDPVAEADVYLAYGRDLQAEEILKDALRTNPDRLAIHQKLLEIYAKRRDAKAFEAIATLAFNLTDGMGPEWEQICEKGLALEPDNALYLPGGQPLAESYSTTRPSSIDSVLPVSGLGQTTAEPEPAIAKDGNVELDLDLDFSLEEPDFGDSIAGDPGIESDTAATPLAFEMPVEVAPPEPEPAPPTAVEPAASLPDLSHADIDMLEADEDDPYGKTQVLSAATEPAKAPPETGMLEFDLGSLSLDFAITKPGDLSHEQKTAEKPVSSDNEDPITQPGAFPEVADDPLETKLALAEEFKAIGDDDGARALIEEVVAEATGDMKVKAQRALSRL